MNVLEEKLRMPSLPPGLDIEVDTMLAASKSVGNGNLEAAVSAATAGDDWFNFHSDAFEVANPEAIASDLVKAQLNSNLAGALGHGLGSEGADGDMSGSENCAKPGSAMSHKSSKDNVSTHIGSSAPSSSSDQDLTSGTGQDARSNTPSVDGDGNAVDGDGKSNGSTPQEAGEEHVHADGALLYYNEPVRQLEHERDVEALLNEALPSVCGAPVPSPPAVPAVVPVVPAVPAVNPAQSPSGSSVQSRPGQPASSNASSHGAPKSVKGVEVPRPSATVVASRKTVAGYASTEVGVGRLGLGKTQGRPVSRHRIERRQPCIRTTSTVQLRRAANSVASSPIVRPCWCVTASMP